MTNKTKHKLEIALMNFSTVTKVFGSYDKAYLYLGEYLQRNTNLYWGWKLKHILNPDRNNGKTFSYGQKRINRKKLQVKITEVKS